MEGVDFFMSTKELTVNAMLSAMCAVLGYLALDLGNFKFTFEGLPIFVAALIFGAKSGAMVGCVGIFLYQILRYGVTLTTPLWVLPYVVAGWVLGRFAERRGLFPDAKPAFFAVLGAQLLITVINTASIYVDSKIYGYYSAAFVFGSLVTRLGIAAVKGALFGIVLPQITPRLQRLLKVRRATA